MNIFWMINLTNKEFFLTYSFQKVLAYLFLHCNEFLINLILHDNFEYF